VGGMVGLSIPGAWAFDRSAYKSVSFNDLMNRWDSDTKSMEPGIVALVKPVKVRSTAILVDSPRKCNTELLARSLVVANFDPAMLKEWKVSYCIIVRDPVTNKEINVFIQDPLAKSLLAASSTGKSITMYAVLWAYQVNKNRETNRPILLLGGYDD
jgi:hypothetical protein